MMRAVSPLRSDVAQARERLAGIATAGTRCDRAAIAEQLLVASTVARSVESLRGGLSPSRVSQARRTSVRSRPSSGARRARRA
jgi:hypothetical protein